MRHFLSVALFLGLLAPAAVFAQIQPMPAHAAVAVNEDGSINDPIEPFNRAVFQFNRGVDFLILKPVTIVYDTVVPTPVRHGVTNFLTNLSTPVVMLNCLLQGNWSGFETSLHRLVINTTLGFGGLNDVASDLHIQPVAADFGQTLGKWGVGHGFYLVLPIIGPSSARDGVGRVADAYADPYNEAFMHSDMDSDWPIWARAGAVVIDARSRYGADYDRVMKTSVDPYVTFRSIYSQRRAYLVQGKTKGVDAYSAAEAQ